MFIHLSTYNSATPMVRFSHGKTEKKKNLVFSMLLSAYSLLESESLLVSGVPGKKSECKLA